MNNENLSSETMRELDQLIERVTNKSGYSNKEEQYKEQLKREFEQKFEEIKKEFDSQIEKLNEKQNSSLDFAEEIKTYLHDGIADLIAEGHSEEEALAITLEKFDEADLQEDFEDFMKTFDDFGIDEEVKRSTEMGETTVKPLEEQNAPWKWGPGIADIEDFGGLVAGGFTVLGAGLGPLIGFLLGGGLSNFFRIQGSWLTTLIGLIAGPVIGVGMGILCYGIISVIGNSKKKKITKD